MKLRTSSYSNLSKPNPNIIAQYQSRKSFAFCNRPKIQQIQKNTSTKQNHLKTVNKQNPTKTFRSPLQQKKQLSSNYSKSQLKQQYQSKYLLNQNSHTKPTVGSIAKMSQKSESNKNLKNKSTADYLLMKTDDSMKQCTFRPKISKKSDNLLKERNGKSVFENLYNFQKKIQIKGAIGTSRPSTSHKQILNKKLNTQSFKDLGKVKQTQKKQIKPFEFIVDRIQQKQQILQQSIDVYRGYKNFKTSQDDEQVEYEADQNLKIYIEQTLNRISLGKKPRIEI